MNCLFFQKWVSATQFSSKIITPLLYFRYFFKETDLTPVLKALNDAVTRTFPMIKYTPISRQEKIKAFVADYFPRAVYDMIYA